MYFEYCKRLSNSLVAHKGPADMIYHMLYRSFEVRTLVPRRRPFPIVWQDIDVFFVENE